MGFSARDRAILDFERCWWTRSGTKEAAIRTELGSSGTRYYELLRHLSTDPTAYDYDPLTVKRLQRRARPSPARARRGHARRSGAPVTAPGRGSGRGGQAIPNTARGAVARRPRRDRRHRRPADPRRQRARHVGHDLHVRHVAAHHDDRGPGTQGAPAERGRGQGLQRVRRAGQRASSSPTSSRRSGTTCRPPPTSTAPARAPWSSASTASRPTATCSPVYGIGNGATAEGFPSTRRRERRAPTAS